MEDADAGIEKAVRRTGGVTHVLIIPFVPLESGAVA
jgi:hypothetical protein